MLTDEQEKELREKLSYYRNRSELMEKESVIFQQLSETNLGRYMLVKNQLDRIQKEQNNEISS